MSLAFVKHGRQVFILKMEEHDRIQKSGVVRSCSDPFARAPGLVYRGFLFNVTKDIESGMCVCVCFRRSAGYRVKEGVEVWGERSKVKNTERRNKDFSCRCRYSKSEKRARQNRTRVDSLCRQGDSKGGGKERESPLSMDILFPFHLLILPSTSSSSYLGGKRSSRSSKEDRNRWASKRDEREKF